MDDRAASQAHPSMVGVPLTGTLGRGRGWEIRPSVKWIGHKAQYISLKPDPFPQGTRKGYPYHGRWDRIAGAFVHGRGTLDGYPGAGTQMGNSALSEMYWAQGPRIRRPVRPLSLRTTNISFMQKNETHPKSCSTLSLTYQ